MRGPMPCAGEALTAMAQKAASAPVFIAADVGGTNARIAVVRGHGDSRVAVLAYRKYGCGDYPSLTAILRDFVAAHPAHAGIDRMAIASAGVVLDDEVINSSLPWHISLSEMRRELHLRELHV